MLCQVLSYNNRCQVVVVGGGLLLICSIRAYYCWVKRRDRAQLRLKANEKRETEQEYILKKQRELENELDEEGVERIVSFESAELLRQLKTGELGSEEVVKAYLYKACKSTASTNSVTEIIRNCEADARELASADKNKLPLYGIPVSLKECMQTKGAASTIGLARQLDNVAAEDCVLVKVLKKCGAVPFAKTNLPQLMMSHESSNPIYGETSNPLHTDLGPTGSASGDSALIAAGASPLGFGTDMAGSIRAPCHLCGICGLKPTKNRISTIGIVADGGIPGQTAVCSTAGPMARDVNGLVSAMRAILCETMFDLDPRVVPIQFREELYASKKPMRIAYYYDDGFSKPVPACQRAVRMAKEALEKAGHTMVPIQIPDLKWLVGIASKCICADGGRWCIEKLEDDIVEESMEPRLQKLRMNSTMKALKIMLLRRSFPRKSDNLEASHPGDCSAHNLWQATAQLEEYKIKFWRDWKEKYNLDGMICPVFPVAAVPKGTLAAPPALFSYLVIYNALNCPAGVVPVTKVTQKDIDDLKQYKGHYGDEWDRMCQNASMHSLGMPVGVQCVTYPWTEEVCLRLMKEVESLLSERAY